MDKKEFHQNLLTATKTVVPFTQEIVVNHLPELVKYIVHIYSNFNAGLEEGEFTFPFVKELNQTTAPIDDMAVVELLWREGAIPEWINIQVESVDAFTTYLRLECCGRFSAEEKHFYHKAEGYPTFHCLSPALPPGVVNEEGEIIKKFDLYWNK